MTVTPLNCISLLQPPTGEAAGADPYGGGFFRFYRRVLEAGIRSRMLTIGGLVALLVVALIGFQGIPQQFFPDATRNQFRIDYWAAQGTPFQFVSGDLKEIEEKSHFDFDVLVSGHEQILGTKEHIKTDKEFVLSVMDNTKQAIELVSEDQIVSTCVDMTTEQWKGKLADLDQFMVEHCKAMKEHLSSKGV
jgi:multidrug efflux pump subunit AcrB